MQSFIQFTSLLALLSTAVAQQYTPDQPNIGALPIDGAEAFIAAVPSANVSNAVPFRYTVMHSSADWSWTVNVTDVAMSNASTDLTNARVAYTTYSFGWPYVLLTLAEMFQYYINSSGVYSQDPKIFISSRYTIPSNTSAAYSTDDAGSCNKLLGSDCVTALLGSIARGRLGSLTSNACHGILYTDNRATFFDLAVPFGLNTTIPLYVNHTWLYEESAPYSGGNTSIFDYEAGRLHVIAFASPAGQTELLCNRASGTSKTSGSVPSSSTTTSTSMSNTGTATPSSTPGAAAIYSPTGSTVLMTGLLSLLVGVF